MLFSAVSVLVVAQSSSEIPEGLMNKPVLSGESTNRHCYKLTLTQIRPVTDTCTTVLEQAVKAHGERAGSRVQLKCDGTR